MRHNFRKKDTISVTNLQPIVIKGDEAMALLFFQESE